MKNRHLIKILVFFVLLTLNLSVFGLTIRKDSIRERNEISAGINISTTGLGVSITKHISNRIAARLNGSFFEKFFDLNKQSTDIQGNIGIRLSTIEAFASYYFFRHLYLSGGLSYNLTKLTVNGQMSKSINIGDVLLEPDDIGEFRIKITPGWKIEPYLGLGVDLIHTKRFVFGIEMGAFFQGAPSVSLQTTGMLTPTGSEDQEKLIEKNISPLVLYPNIALQFSYNLKFKKHE